MICFAMTSQNGPDSGLEYLLSLDGDIQVQDDGEHWIKIEAKRVDVSPDRPRGIKYSLTLHGVDGERLIGFDNAHAVPPTGSHFKHAGKKYPFDHQHRHAKDEGVLYEFDTAYQLLSDFYER
jgi:hypothetical protein